ncbi:hypothetical protein COLO4_31491 [Corchorus olitorius]|uniref:Uncharacterized protein n=1 Tax=Corchorus olitorius TaxID=93759 RepID=A0A1R3H4B2_9ROSI|nr:hypothetical protein COLO4_31491 [Corchorus olitorius]
MASANWVCVALVLSLGLTMCSGQRAGSRLSTMNDESSSLNLTEQGNMNGSNSVYVEADSNSAESMQTNTNEFDWGGGVDVDIIGGGFCNLVNDCQREGCSQQLDELRKTVMELSMKVDAKLQSHMMDAMAPESG